MRLLKCPVCGYALGHYETWLKVGRVLMLAADRWYFNRETAQWRRGSRKRKHRLVQHGLRPESDERDGYDLILDEERFYWRLWEPAELACPECSTPYQHGVT